MGKGVGIARLKPWAITFLCPHSAGKMTGFDIMILTQGRFSIVADRGVGGGGGSAGEGVL